MRTHGGGWGWRCPPRLPPPLPPDSKQLRPEKDCFLWKKKKKRKQKTSQGPAIVLCKIHCSDCSLVHFNEALIAREITHACHPMRRARGCRTGPPRHQHKHLPQSSSCPPEPLASLFLGADTAGHPGEEGLGFSKGRAPQDREASADVPGDQQLPLLCPGHVPASHSRSTLADAPHITAEMQLVLHRVHLGLKWFNLLHAATSCGPCPLQRTWGDVHAPFPQPRKTGASCWKHWAGNSFCPEHSNVLLSPSLPDPGGCPGTRSIPSRAAAFPQGGDGRLSEVCLILWETTKPLQ